MRRLHAHMLEIRNTGIQCCHLCEVTFVLSRAITDKVVDSEALILKAMPVFLLTYTNASLKRTVYILTVIGKPVSLVFKYN